MKKTIAVRRIMDAKECGLPRACEIYKYLTCYGEIELTKEALETYLENN